MWFLSLVIGLNKLQIMGHWYPLESAEFLIFLMIFMIYLVAFTTLPMDLEVGLFMTGFRN